MKASSSHVREPAASSATLSVMHLCAPAHVGGLERVVQGLSTGQVLRSQRVAVVAVIQPGADTSAFLDPLRAVGVECIRIEAPGRGYLSELRQVRALLASWQPDILHTHGYRSDLLHGGVARRRGIATVTTLHGSSRMGGASHLFEWIQEWALRRFDGVVAVSEPLVRSLRARGVPEERIHEVPNAWTPPAGPLLREEARRALDAPETGLLVGWVGRLIPVKGCDVFLRALSRVRGEDYRAVIIGDGPERAALEALASELGLTNQVRFLGAVPDAARFFSGLDLFVLSSRSEGTPMVLLEAMGAGLPVVATSVGGVPDVIADEVGGWLVPPEQPDRMAEAVTLAIGDAGARRDRAALGAERIRSHYSREAWILRHEEVYRAALKVRREGRGRA